MGVKKAVGPSRSAEGYKAAQTELNSLISALDKDIARISVDVQSKESANVKLKDQISKLTVLLAQLNNKKAQDSKDSDAAILASINAQKKTTDDFSIFVPEISERINSITAKTEAAERENLELREKLLAGAEEFESRREKLLVDMANMEAMKNKGRKKKVEVEVGTEAEAEAEAPSDRERGESSASAGPAAAPGVLPPLPPADAEAEADIEISTDSVQAAETQSAATAASSSSGGAATAADTEEAAALLTDEEEEAAAEAALLQQMEKSKDEFTKESHALYEEELKLRKKIIAQAGTLTKLQEGLTATNTEFQTQTTEIESLVGTLNALEKEQEKGKIRLLELSAKAAPASKARTDAIKEGEKYDQLMQALNAAIAKAMEASPASAAPAAAPAAAAGGASSSGALSSSSSPAAPASAAQSGVGFG